MQKINLKKDFEKLVPEKAKKALYLCSKAADELSLKIFLIGGVVRDIIIGKANFDTDITVQGNAIDFAYFLEKSYPETCKIKEIHDKFKTAKVIFAIDNEKIEIDIASTRKESYPYPASLPLVEEIGCELYADVKRRDFTINSMALCLNKANFGDLIDYLGGYEDIKQKKIRILHPISFIDDPTRIIRALKFRIRFNYELEEETRILQEKCLEPGRFDNLCGERIKAEIKQTFNLNKTEGMETFINENIYRLLSNSKEIKESYNLSKACQLIVSEYFNYINPDFVWLIYLGVMLSDFSQEKINEIAEKLHLSGIETNILTGARILLEKSEFLNKNTTNFEVYEFFEGFMPESLLIFLVKESEFKEKLDLYLKELKDIKIYTTGKNLIDLGLKSGPAFGEILRKLLKARINGEFSSEEEEREFLKNFINQ